MLNADLQYLIVGSGLTGSTIARVLTDAGKRVLIVERRSHAGGNVHDQIHECGIAYHTYGPHYFRTNSERVWCFVQRFASFVEFHPVMKTLVDGTIENWPLTRSQIARFGEGDIEPPFSGHPTNFEEACLAKLPRGVYEKFIKGYTEKQWGTSATELSSMLARRIVILEDDQTFGSIFRHSALPRDGYSAFTKRILADIPVLYDFDFLKHRGDVPAQVQTIFTGPIDEYFDFDLGRLQYRGQRREHSVLQMSGFSQPAIQLNNPSPLAGGHVRTIEWKHLVNQFNVIDTSTLLTREFPYFPNDPENYEYPMPDSMNAQLYREYSLRASKIENLIVCGRLGEYRYLDMDQAIGKALLIADRLLAE